MSNLGSLGNLNNVVKSLRFVNLLLLLFGMGGKVFQYVGMDNYFLNSVGFLLMNFVGFMVLNVNMMNKNIVYNSINSMGV